MPEHLKCARQIWPVHATDARWPKRFGPSPRSLPLKRWMRRWRCSSVSMSRAYKRCSRRPGLKSEKLNAPRGALEERLAEMPEPPPPRLPERLIQRQRPELASGVPRTAVAATPKLESCESGGFRRHGRSSLPRRTHRTPGGHCGSVKSVMMRRRRLWPCRTARSVVLPAQD